MPASRNTWGTVKKRSKKRVPLRGIEPRKNHYGKSTLSSRTALRQYIHNYESTRTNSCPCVGSRTLRKVKTIDTILADGINITMKNTYVARLSRVMPQHSNKKRSNNE